MSLIIQKLSLCVDSFLGYKKLAATTPKMLLDDVSFDVESGQLCAIVGPNGAGKSTLLRCIVGLHNKYQGDIHYDNQHLLKLSPKERAHLMAYLPQKPICHWSLTCEQVLRLVMTHDSAYDNDYYQSLVADLDLQHLLHRRFDTLSGGEQARLMLARSLINNPSLLLADEPIASLDIRYQLQVLKYLKRVAQKGSMVMVVLHDLNLALQYCDKVVVLNNGQCVATGDQQQIIESRILDHTFQTRFTTLHVNDQPFLVVEDARTEH